MDRFSLRSLLFFSLLCAAPLAADAPRGLVLITLDTTRADHLGAYGYAAARTPTLDALAERGTRYAHALTASPLTLPAHATLLTGLLPPEHGVRDNGTAVLAGDIPTLADALDASGWKTAAFVASRVLDRRFGLARGFDEYDDRMLAERAGEYGYAERDAATVTDAALAWLASAAKDHFLLWVHYYDPHAPYQAPGETDVQRYDAEIAKVDRELARLLAALPENVLIAVVGDHGESLGEHGERTHGLFLYRAALEVPLLLAGPGVAAGKVIERTVPTHLLAATLLHLLGVPHGLPPERLPPEDGDKEIAIYSEARLPLTAYGWSPLRALTSGQWRLIAAPRPELYDLASDPAETRNLLTENRREARRLATALEKTEAGFILRTAAPAQTDAELAASLRSLGYMSGASGTTNESSPRIDPKDGIAMLGELEQADRLAAQGDFAAALEKYRALVVRSPNNVPFLTHWARTAVAAGRGEEGLDAYRRAIALNPRLEFLHLNMAHALLALGRKDDAIAAYRHVLELDPRFAAAWLALAEIAKAEVDKERRLLEEALAAGTISAAISLRLGQIAMEAGDASAAEHLRRAVEWAPGWSLAWFLRGEDFARRGEHSAAREAYGRVLGLESGSDLARVVRERLRTLASP